MIEDSLKQGLTSANLSSQVKSAGSASEGDSQDWFAAMSKAWGETLNQSANKVVELSNNIGEGDTAIQNMTLLTAEAQRLGFISTSASSAINSAGKALETMARKQ